MSAFEDADVEQWRADVQQDIVDSWISKTNDLGAPAAEFLELYNAAYESHHETSEYVSGISACIERAGS